MFRNLLKPDSPLMITMSRITDYIFLSCFWLLCCIPVVTIGTSTAALYDASYRAFRKVCELIVELMRQFYTAPRCFRILDEGSGEEFINYSNGGLQLQGQGNALYKPVFDIQITAQKHSPYARLSQNELAMQFYTAGFFDPARAEQALACLEMMDFDRKDFVMQSVVRNAIAMERRSMAPAAVAERSAEPAGVVQAKRRVAESGNP